MSGILTFWTLIVAIVLVAWRGNRWFAKKNPALSGSHLGEEYQFHEEHSKAGLLINLLLTFNLPPERRFQLRREGWFDRFGKGIHLSVEPQANDPEFDRLFYVDSDDDGLIDLLRNNQLLKSTLVGLLIRLQSNEAKLISLSAEDGTLSLYIRVFSTLNPEALRSQCVARLMPLLEAIRAMPQGKAARRRRTPDEVTRQISLGLFALGGFTSSWIYFMSPDRLTNPWELIKWSSIIAAAVFLPLTIWALPRLGRASNRHRALLQWIFLSSIGCVLCSFVVIRAANIHLDFRQSSGEILDHVELFETYRRKHGTIYKVKIHGKDWSEHRNEFMEIGWFEHRRLSRAWLGDTSGEAILLTHPGLLGFAWREILP